MYAAAPRRGLNNFARPLLPLNHRIARPPDSNIPDRRPGELFQPFDVALRVSWEIVEGADAVAVG